MRTFLQVEIDPELKEKFREIAKAQGTDASTIVRKWVHEYVEKNSVEHVEATENLYDRGNELKKVLSVDKNSKKDLWELMNFLKEDKINEFMSKVMMLYVKHDLVMPNELLNIQEKSDYGYAYLMGLMGDQRKKTSDN